MISYAWKILYNLDFHCTQREIVERKREGDRHEERSPIKINQIPHMTVIIQYTTQRSLYSIIFIIKIL